ncbi:hypothetical protein H0H87_006505 [Tephrocybe sp. NHM501043]|nr:hypothetical protein H0H87_006505 [Tephrocybe sp. NHM501043]
MASQIAECLTATLSPDQSTRVAAELKLVEYFASPDTGLALSQMILAQDADMSLRQMSFPRFVSLNRVLILSEALSKHFASKICPGAVIKSHIRQNVFNALSDSNRKIRSLCAYTLSSIANSDWPDEYPDLLNSLINLLSSGSPGSVHGAMQVFTEFIKSDLTEDQILPVLRQLLPFLLSILGSNETHSAPTRARSVSVFRQCVTALFMVKDQYPQGTKEAVSTILPVWLEAFKVLLQIDPKLDVTNTDNWDGLAVRIQIFKTLDTIHVSFPRVLKPYLQDFLSMSLVHLQALRPEFIQYYLSSSDSAPGSSEDEPIELPQLISPIMDFAAAVTRGGKARDWFTSDNLNAIVVAIFDFVQMTHEDEDTWANNANAFVAQEDDETEAYSVRVAGFDFLSCLIDRNPTNTAQTLQLAVQHVIQSSQQQRDAGREDWWRPLEATLAAIGSQAEAILDCIDDEVDSGRQKPIDIEYLLSNVIPSILNLSQHSFLQGRGFVFASQYSRLLPAELAGQYLDAALHVIEAPSGGIPVKISAVKAIHNFFQGRADSYLSNLAPRITKGLSPFLFVTSDDTLTLVLETLAVVLEVEKAKWLTTEMAESLVLALLEVWNKNNKDPIFLSILTDIFATLSGSSAPGIYEAVVKQALPPLSVAVASASAEESWIAGTAIELITSLVQGSPERGLGDGFFALVAPNLFKCLGEAGDRDVLQNGIVCLTVVIRKDCNQLLSWSDGNGRTGLEYTLILIAKVLESDDESGGLAIGDLIIHLLRKAGEAVLPVLPQLLQAMVGRMRSAKTATFLQSLVIPFAFLINNQRDTVLSLLETTTVDGRSGLEILVTTWCENAETFQGFWPSRISTLGLMQLFVAERASLQNLTVKGDIIVDRTNKNGESFSARPHLLLARSILLPYSSFAR